MDTPAHQCHQARARPAPPKRPVSTAPGTRSAHHCKVASSVSVSSLNAARWQLSDIAVCEVPTPIYRSSEISS
jgi:hypothetical protein